MDEINERHRRAHGVSFSLRVGINSGEVLAGQVGDGYTVIGDAVNVAARLQAAARPGSVTVGEITHRLTRGAIEYDELEPLEPQGQVRAGAGLGGRPRAGPRPGDPRRRAPWRRCRPRGRVGAALVAVRAGRPREPPAPGHGHRPGRGRQVAPAARAGGADRPSARRSRPSGSGAAPPTAPGSPTGRSARSCAASSSIVDTDDSELAWAKLLRRGRVGRLRRRDRRAARADRRGDRPPARHRAPGRAAMRPASTSSTTRSRSATACSPPCARWSRR